MFANVLRSPANYRVGLVGTLTTQHDPSVTTEYAVVTRLWPQSMLSSMSDSDTSHRLRDGSPRKRKLGTTRSVGSSGRRSGHSIFRSKLCRLSEDWSACFLLCQKPCLSDFCLPLSFYFIFLSQTKQAQNSFQLFYKMACVVNSRETEDDDEVMLNVLRCRLTY